MMVKALVLTAASQCLIATALAEDAAPDTEASRYMFSKIAEGFLRLDTHTGEVSVCGQRTVGWACQAVPEDRVVLENEIARLRRENAALKKDILARGLPLPAGSAPEPPVAGYNGDQPSPTAKSDFDRLVGLVGQAWRRLVEAIARAEAAAERKLMRR